MDFSALRQRAVLLKPTSITKNNFGELVPVWTAFHPVKNPDGSGEGLRLTLDKAGHAFLTDEAGNSASPHQIEAFAVCVAVVPLTGREYEQSQTLRTETTYRVLTRFYAGITPDMKLFYRGKTLSIISVLNVDERNEQLVIVAAEDGSHGTG